MENQALKTMGAGFAARRAHNRTRMKRAEMRTMALRATIAMTLVSVVMSAFLLL